MTIEPIFFQKKLIILANILSIISNGYDRYDR
jgi:hypothetical protein